MSTQQFNGAMNEFMNPGCEEEMRVSLLKTLMAETQDDADQDEVIRAATSMMDSADALYDEIRDQLLSDPQWKLAVLNFCPGEGEHDELRSWFYCLQRFEREQLLTIRERLYQMMDICIANSSSGEDFSAAAHVMVDLSEPLATRKTIHYLAESNHFELIDPSKLFGFEDELFAMFDEDPGEFLESSLLFFAQTAFNWGKRSPKDSRLATRAAEFMRDLNHDFHVYLLLTGFIPILGTTAELTLPALRNLEAKLSVEKKQSFEDEIATDYLITVDADDFEMDKDDEESHLALVRKLISSLS